MPWDVVYTDHFETWLETCSTSLQNETLAHIELLAIMGVNLPFPYCSQIKGTRLTGMRELRFRYRKRDIRILYIFDPSRRAVLLVGGDKTGDKQWYEKHIPLAENVFRDYSQSN
ncbi:MAG: type II toxin-antitoxin system RelE/ParE family toxin [Synergistota bacterium]|nr:type II toxin-antitoxin system RelE/ParE family toxin [Synergistota bacterium]